FAAMGARTQPLPGGMRVELTREQLALLENRPLWTLGLWAGADAGLTTLYFAFEDPQTEAAHPGEPLAPGSPRLEQMCGLALRECALGGARLRPASGRGGPLRPFLVFHFVVARVGRSVRERLEPVAVDLVDGAAFPCPPLLDEPLEAMGDGVADAERPRLSVGDAHQRAVDALCRQLADEDPSWYMEALLRLEEELDRLYAYLERATAGRPRRSVICAIRMEGDTRSRQLAEEDPSWYMEAQLRIEDELDRLYAYLERATAERPPDRAAVALARARIAELHELSRPRIEVRARAATLLYAPAYWPKPCSMYLSRRRQ